MPDMREIRQGRGGGSRDEKNVPPFNVGENRNMNRNRNNYTAVHLQPRKPKEPFIFDGEPAGFSLLDFWIWSGSDVLDNILRGQIAEYIVAQATGAEVSAIYSRWQSQDIMTSRGITIEVKSAAYFQSHHQDGPSKISFNIKKTRPWDNETNQREKTPRRSAQVYVFCLLANKDRSTIKPLDLSQWKFYILPTTVIDSSLGNQKSVGLSRLEELGAKIVNYDQIDDTILQVQCDYGLVSFQ